MDAMKAIGVLLVCALVAVCQREDSMQPTAQNTSAEHFQSDFQPSRPRNARSIDVSVANAVGTMQRLARVTNAISLQQSIVDGSFSSDDVFADLLRMGTLRPSSIEKMDVGGIEKAFEMMKAVQLKDAADVEKFFGEMDEISREVNGVGQLKDWNPETFRKDIDSLSYFAESIKNGIIKTAKSWVISYDNMEFLKNPSDAQEVAKTKAALHDLQNKSMELRKMIVEEDLSKTPTFEFKKIQSARSEFSLVRKTLKGMFVYENKNQITFNILDKKDKFTTNSDNFKAVKSVALNAGLTDLLKNLLVFYKNQKSGGSQMLKKTSAFPNGLEDMKSIDEDIGYLKEIVSSGNKLEAALEPLKDFESLQKISNTLRTTDDQKLERLAEVIEIVDTISNAGSSISSVEAIRTLVKQFRSKPHRSRTVDEAMGKISSQVEKVDASVIGLDVFVIEMAANLTTGDAGTVLQEIINMPKDLSADKLQDAIKKMKSNVKALDVKAYLKLLDPKFDDIVNSVVGASGEITDNLKSLDTFKTETAEFIQFFETLRAHSDQVMRMLQTIEKLRNKDPMFADVIDILKQVKSSSETFGRLNSTIADKKSSPSKETTALSTQTSLKTASEVIGTATRGIAMMKSVLEKPLVFDSKKWMDVVWREKKKVVVPLDSATLERLARIKSIEGSLRTVNSDFEAWNNEVKSLEVSALGDHSGIFSAAAKYTGVDIDFSEMSNAVEALQKAISAPTSSLNRKRAAGQHNTLDDLKAEFDKFASMGLALTNYKTAFQGSKDALQALDAFFSGFADAVRPPLPPNPDGNQGGNNSRPGDVDYYYVDDDGGDEDEDVSSTTAAPTDGTNLTLIVSVIGGVIGAVVLISIAVCLILICRNKDPPTSGSSTDVSTAIEGTKDELAAAANRKADDEKKKIEEKDKELEDAKKVKEEKEKEAAHAIKEKEEKEKELQDAIKVKEEKEKEAADAKKEADELRKKTIAQEKMDAVRIAKAREMQNVQVEWKLAIMYVEGLSSQVKKFTADKLKKDQAKLMREGKSKDDAKKASLEESFDSMFRKIYAAVGAETNFGVSKNLNKYKNEIRVKGQVLRELTQVEVKNAPAGWFTTKFMHANMVTMPNEMRMILCQGPLAPNPANNVIGNIDKFLWMIYEQNTKHVVMLCQLTEDGNEKCDAYFADDVGQVMKFEHCEVKCTKKNVKGELIERGQTITFKDGTVCKYTHIQYVGWPDHSAPSSPDVVLQMLKMVRQNNTPIIVHCSAGIGRSGSFAFIEYGYQTVAKSGQLVFSVVLGQIRSMRAGAVQDVIQLAFCAIAVLEFVWECGTKEQRAGEFAKRRSKMLDCYAAMRVNEGKQGAKNAEASTTRTDAAREA